MSGIAKEISFLLFGKTVEREGEGSLRTHLDLGSNEYGVDTDYEAEPSEAHRDQPVRPYSLKPLVVTSFAILGVLCIYNVVLWSQMWVVAKFLCGFLYVIPFTLFILAVKRSRERTHTAFRFILIFLHAGLYGATGYLIIIAYGWASGMFLLIVGVAIHLLLLSAINKLKEDNFNIRDIV